MCVMCLRGRYVCMMYVMCDVCDVFVMYVMSDVCDV